MTDSTRSQGLVVSFVTACLMTGMFVTGCGNGVDTGDADVVISDTMVDSFTTADAVDVVSTDARDAVMDVSVDTSDYTVTDEYAGDISPVDAEESDAAIDSSAPDAVTDAHDVFLDADASIPVDAEDAIQPDDAEVIPETDTHEIECVTGPYCATDNDCPPFEGKHCNLALDPPQCQILYCGDVTSPCSEEALCASRICFNDQCCQPDCGGRECGDDGCGGSCGECIGEGSYCTEGHCCIPDCGFLECGPDPVCGVECGPCPDGFACTTDFRCIDVSGMAFVDAGSFWMGCNNTDDGCQSDETSSHLVTLSAFYMDKTEVTVGMYAECVEAGFCSEPSTDDEQCSWGNEFRDDFPINCVNWDQAKIYCGWAGKRLPTEAEWEKAARGTDGRKYPWGNEIATCDYAVMYDGVEWGCGTGTPWPVCSKSPAGDSPYGLCDMSGNVWEWVSDWYYYYNNNLSVNPTGPFGGTYRVIRGGSFLDGGVGAFARAYDTPPDTYNYGFFLGFRCVIGDGVVGEICDGLDNDHNGLTDEDFKFADWNNAEKVLGEDCGTGACAGGTVVCSEDGSHSICSTAVLASVEVTNDDIDDDCDGLVEKHLVECLNGMCLIPAGSFWMGCNATVDSQCDSSELPYHEVTLSRFYMDKTEVTQGEYKKCIDAGECDTPSCNWDPTGKPNRPVVCVNWTQAGEYCTWAGKRLPTEAEWEKAARGMDGRKYPWGNETATCDYAVMVDGGAGCGTNSTWDVCSKSPAGDSPYGLCDMSGNVWEWVSDWFDPGYYTNSPASNPTGPVSGSPRVRRGGSFGFSGYALRASFRDYVNPSYYDDSLGFRCARPQ